MQPMTPEQMQTQKIDGKAAEMQQQQSLRNDPTQQSPVDALREMLMPQRPTLKPLPTMRVFSMNGQTIGDAKTK
jgi:hypothetical protein